MKTQIENILKAAKVPCYNVYEYQGMAGNYLAIQMYTSEELINGVRGQQPNKVSLSLLLDEMELKVQGYAGTGGQTIYRKPNKENDREKYLAMTGIRIPFRKPANTEEAVLKAVKRFAENWLKTLEENKSVLVHPF